jgi:hypothetical protein
MTLGKLQQPWPRVPDERQVKHIANIRDACEILRAVMHEAEGSTQAGDHEEHHFSTRRMSIAATHLEIVEMFAVKAALE